MKQILIYIISIFLFIGCNDQEMENITLHTQDIELQNAKKAIERLIAKPLTKGESLPIYTLSLRECKQMKVKIDGGSEQDSIKLFTFLQLSIRSYFLRTIISAIRSNAFFP